MENLDNNELYHKGSILLQSALKKYSEGDFEGGDKDREQANYFYDLAKKETDRVGDNITALYGENRNFGTIYHVFKENVKDILKENKNTKAIANIVKLIKSNKVLNEEFKIYDAFCNKKINVEPIEYINEALNILPTFTKKELIENNNELIKSIKKYKLDEFIDIDDDTMDLYESIEFLLTNKRSLDNIEDYKKHKNVIKESITKRLTGNIKDVESDIVNEKDYRNDLRNIIDKHSKNLTEDEIALMAEICENDKKNVFNKYKNETLKFISEQISSSVDLEDKIDWNNILNKVSLKEYNENTIFEDVISFVNIKSIIEE